MALSDNLTSFSAVLAKLPQQRIAQAISVLFLIYVAFMAAKITWLVVPQQSIERNNPVTKHAVSKNNSTASFNVSALQALNLFGQYNKPTTENVAVQITDAPETRLQLTLSGIVASDHPETAAAIIENKGKQETYGIGDVIQGTRASLEQVLIDRVFIKQSGRLETLMLDGADFNQPAQSVANVKAKTTQNANLTSVKNSTPNVVDHRSNKELSANVQRLRADLTSNPGKITDYLSISPANKDGRVVGYRLSPGKSPEFFKLSGLKSGDIAVQMNGHDLLLPVELAQAMSALKTERDISLLVDRQGDLIEILFSIN